MNVIRKMNLLLPRSSLLTIYKSFSRLRLDFVDVIYDQPNNSRLSNKIETSQYIAALAIICVISGTSKDQLYQELGLGSSKDRRWLRRMSYLYEIVLTKLPFDFYETVLPLERSHQYLRCFQTLRFRTTFFQNSFLSFTITKWNNLILKILIPMQCSLKSF